MMGRGTARKTRQGKGAGHQEQVKELEADAQAAAAGQGLSGVTSQAPTRPPPGPRLSNLFIVRFEKRQGKK